MKISVEIVEREGVWEWKVVQSRDFLSRALLGEDTIDSGRDTTIQSAVYHAKQALTGFLRGYGNV